VAVELRLPSGDLVDVETLKEDTSVVSGMSMIGAGEELICGRVVETAEPD
jgi:hypothetical protein